MDKLSVVFRVHRGEVIGLICHTGKDCRPGNVMGYAHAGQRSEMPRSLGRYARLATPEEYAGLKRELERVYGTPVVAVERLVA